jgi:hypothetical protein
MSLRFRPREGEQDLAWLAQATGNLTELYNDLLRLQLAADAADEATKPLTDDQLKTVVDDRAGELGTPLVQVSEGSMILQLSQYVDATVGVQVLVALGILLKKGPEVVAFPHKLKAKWYSSAADALRARNAYEQLKRESIITVIESPQGHNRKITEPVREGVNETSGPASSPPASTGLPSSPPVSSPPASSGPVSSGS